MSDAGHTEPTTLENSRLAIARRLAGDVLQRPSRLLLEANRAYYWRLGTRPYNPDGVDVLAADWDTLVVLDACRYDMFEHANTLPGDLQSRISRGANTVEFLRGNFDGREALDTVYVTANPRFFRRQDAIDVTFHAVENVWKDEWDSQEQTVLPETTTDRALAATERYPNKRQIVHFMQPHYPFVGSDIDTGEMRDEHNPSVWDLVQSGELDADRVCRDYRENLAVTMPAIERLLEELDGRTVVTADHGNLLGERIRPLPVTEWGHPGGIHAPELVRVPWLVHESGPRRTVTAEAPAAAVEAEVADETVTERLAELGYRT